VSMRTQKELEMNVLEYDSIVRTNSDVSKLTKAKLRKLKLQRSDSNGGGGRWA